jgi:exodeoxyribonuclease V beta subunit
VANHYGITIANMETNYRSSQAVVEQVNRWFEPNMEGFPKAKYKEGATRGYVEVRESELLVDEAILSLESLLKRGVALTDIAFLVSTNKDGATIQEACYLKGYATRLKTSSSLKHTPKVASLVAMVAYLFGGLELDATALLQQIDRPIEEMDTSWFHPFMQPVAVLHRLIIDFGYFEADLNLLKLLEFASDFSNIATFIEEFELSSIDVASSSKEGAMIMTIHGSKGLEFEHVILLDRLKGIAPDRSTLLYDYDDSLHIKEVCYKIGGRENFDASYREILEKQKKLLAKDKMNILYVALTRAVEGMTIIRKPKASIFDPLGITPMSVGEFNATEEPKKQHSSPMLEKVTLSYYGTQEVDKEEEGEEEEEKDYDAILFGLALHYTLEMMSSFSIMGLAEAISATKNRYGLELDEHQLSDIKSRILSLLTHERFKKMLHQVTIKKEQSLAFEGQFKQIDLLLEYSKSCMVLEYKSSKKYHQKHQSQVSYYRKAIASITGKYTRGIIVYLLEEGVEFVEV